MPDNSRGGRKRKHPASPSSTNPRQSPYHPNNDSRNNNNRGGRNVRRPSGQYSGAGSPPLNHHHQQQQQQQQQQSTTRSHLPSRLSMSNTGNNNAPSAPPSAPPPAAPAPPNRGPAAPAVAAADEMQIDPPAPDASKDEPKQYYYYWEYVTDEVLKDWSASGSAVVKKKLVELASDKENEPETSIVFQELIRTAIEARLSPFMVARFLVDFFEKLEPTANSLDANELKRIFLMTVNLFETTETASVPPPNLLKLLQDLRPRVFSDELLGSYLETPTLVHLNIVTSQYSKKAVRVTTALVYKQRKHNLLREETEGFSKLITEFFTSSYSQNPLEIVDRTGERVKGLIGAFELDPARVLDILLDTAACTVVSNARFFVRLLKGSAWWPQQLQHSNDEPRPEEEKERSDAEFFDRLANEGIEVFFGDLKASGKGNKVAAQLLGFKFRYYQKDDVRERTPENLLALSAVLIKLGFIDLADLYPHLAPTEEEGMTEVLNNWETKLKESNRTTKKNALMMASALSDDTAPPPPRMRPSANGEEKKPEEPKKEEEPRPKKDDNQKLTLAKFLLAVGALPEAMFILGKYPWLAGPSSGIAEHLSRVILQSLEAVYANHRPPKIELGTKKTASPTGAKNGGVVLHDQIPQRTLVTFTVSSLKYKTGETLYRFFWEEWKDGVPVCRNSRHVVLLMQTLGRYLGVEIGRDPAIMTRLCRIGRDVLKDSNCDAADRKSWIELCRTLLIPAISLTDGNQGVVNEVWKLLECFTTRERYSLYGEWTSVSLKRSPQLRNMLTTTERETSQLLKRISKTNIKQIARQMAKVAVSNPVTMIQNVLKQVETYDNLTECIVDAAAYFTPLCFDAIGFCVLNSMSNDTKSRVQEDGMLTSRWLQSLAAFVGKFYTRYHERVDPAPILEYVARQLKRQRSVELLVLQEMMQSMAGVNPETNLNDAQLQALAGGEVLRGQILNAFRDRKAENTPETTKSLTDSLSKSGLAAALLVLIAQERQTCIFREEDSGAPLKVLANLFDDIHIVLSQYLDLMKMGFTPEQFEAVVPSVGPLCLKYGIDPPVAWWLYRFGLKSRMNKIKASETEDVEMKDASQPKDSSPEKTEKPEKPETPEKKSPWNPILEKLMEEVKPILPEQVWSKLSVGFYITFWQLEIYDIFVPMDAYSAETGRINAAVRAIDNDRSNHSADRAKKSAERSRLLEVSARLSAELKVHIRDHNFARRRLSAEKDHWFNDERFDQRDVTNTFIQYCLFPRVMQSPNDASFCSRFIRQIHQIGAPKFHTVGVYDAIFGKALGPVIFMCTQREAENYGRFLKEVLTDLHAWHADKAVYEREAHGAKKDLIGFHVKGKPFDWEDFRKILYKWHKTLHTAVKNCLSSKEYMHIRNAIVVLKHVVDFFPAVEWIGRTVVEKVEELSEKEKREDLKIAATTLLGMLKKRKKDWVVVAAFQKSEALAPGMMKPSPTPTPTDNKPTSPDSSQQQSQQQQQQLPASRPLSSLAKEFRPNSTSDASNANQQPLGRQQSSAPVLPPKPQGRDEPQFDDRRGRVQPANLPQRPQPPASQGRREPMTPSRDNQQYPPQQQQQQTSHSSSSSRAPTPRRDDQRTPNDARRQDLNRPNSGRVPIDQLPQHQLPERPDTARQTTLERRDTIRQDARNRQDGRLPEKPLDRRHSPRRDGRDVRDSPRDIVRDMAMPHRHDLDRRGLPSGRDLEFQRPVLPHGRDERGRRDERLLDIDQRPSPNAGRGMDAMDLDDRRMDIDDRRMDIDERRMEIDDRRMDMDDRRMGRDDRDSSRRRGDRHDHASPQAGRLNDYPMDRLDRPERLDRPDRLDRNDRLDRPDRLERLDRGEHLDAMRKPTHMMEQVPRHAAEDMMGPQRVLPTGPRGSFGRQQQPSQKDLFTNTPAGSQMRGPPVGPTHPHPSETLREPRHNGNYGHHQKDPNHGRLNPPEPAAPKQSIPKGPRQAGNNPHFNPRGNGGINIRGSAAAQQAASQTGPQNQQNQQASPALPAQPAPLPARAVPPSPKLEMPPPAQDRVSRSEPSTPTVDIVGIHPDRLKAMGVSSQAGPESVRQQTQSQQQGGRSFPSNPPTLATSQAPAGPRSGSGELERDRSGRHTPAESNNPAEVTLPVKSESKATSPPTGPARRDGIDEARNQRRRILNVQSHLTNDDGREARSRGGRRNGSTAVTPTNTAPPTPLSRQHSTPDLTAGRSRGQAPSNPPPSLDRRMSNSNIIDSRRSSTAMPSERELRQSQSVDDLRSTEGHSRRHHRSEHRSDRDRDRRAVEAERERERERELITPATGGRESRKGSDRGGSSGRDRGHGDREERHRGRDRGEERESGRDRRKRDHPRPDETEREREEVKRRRRGGRTEDQSEWPTTRGSAR